MRHSPLKLRQTSTGVDGCTLEVGGELDVATVNQFRRAISTLMGTGCRQIVVDLRETTFLDSSGLGALVWAAHRMQAAGGGLTVVNPDEQVAKILRVTGVERVLVGPH